jgi:hypothetical protein
MRSVDYLAENSAERTVQLPVALSVAYSVAYSGVSRANSTAGSWAYVMEAQTESTWVEKMGASMAVCLGCKSARKLVE